MTTERTFVDDTRGAILRDAPDSVILKVNDNFTVGIPDLLIFEAGRTFALELKATRTLPRDPDSPRWLDHPLSSTQCNMLRKLAANQVVSFALIRVLKTAEIWALKAYFCIPDLSYNHVRANGFQISLAPGLLDRLSHLHRSPT